MGPAAWRYIGSASRSVCSRGERCSELGNETVEMKVKETDVRSNMKRNSKTRHDELVTPTPCAEESCKDSYSHGFYYVIGLVTLNTPGVYCLPYILHLSSYFPRLSIVLPHNHPSSVDSPPHQENRSPRFGGLHLLGEQVETPPSHQSWETTK